MGYFFLMNMQVGTTTRSADDGQLIRFINTRNIYMVVVRSKCRTRETRFDPNVPLAIIIQLINFPTISDKH